MSEFAITCNSIEGLGERSLYSRIEACESAASICQAPAGTTISEVNSEDCIGSFLPI